MKQPPEALAGNLPAQVLHCMEKSHMFQITAATEREAQEAIQIVSQELHEKKTEGGFTGSSGTRYQWSAHTSYEDVYIGKKLVYQRRVMDVKIKPDM